jgi:hypothetical protein
MSARRETDMVLGPDDLDCSAEIALSTGVTYLVVTGVDEVSADSSDWKLWVNPADLGGTEPTPDSAARWRKYNTSVRSIYIGNDESPGSGESVLTDVYVDEFRVGRTFADVTPEDATPRSTLFIIK